MNSSPIAFTRSQHLILLGLLDTFIILRGVNFTQDIKWLLEYRRNLYAVTIGAE